MEEKKTIFDYVTMTFSIFGFSIAWLNFFSFLFGEEAKEISSMFSLGSNGLSIATMMQFLGVAVITTFIRYIFFTDIIIKKMPIVGRTACMVLSEISTIVVFVLCFDWFPTDMWLPWVMFIMCFGLCFVVSTIVTMWKEKMENRKMEEALAKLKKQEAVFYEGEGETDKNGICN